MPEKRSNSTQTDWSMIAAAVAENVDTSAAEEAMEGLARRYWPAVYAYVRSTGRDVHEAADLTQGFICDVVIARRLFEVADPSRGRFRALLLTALRNYLASESRSSRRRQPSSSGARSSAQPSAHSATPRKREPFNLFLSDLDRCEPETSPSPEAAFAAQWTALLVRSVLEKVREGCLKDGLEPHWTIFEYRVVRPLLLGDEPTPYHVLAERLELSETAHGPNMMVTVKRRFAKAMYLEVCTTVEGAAQAEGELFELLRDIERQ